jgi:hypothetical protein
LREERKSREYMPGDVVRMELHVENDGANLDNAFARFTHERDQQYHLILAQDMAAMIRGEVADGGTENRVLVEATVPAAIPEGEYVLEQVHVRCASGRIYRFTKGMLPSPGARFGVVKEPAGRMVLKGVTLMD